MKLSFRTILFGAAICVSGVALAQTAGPTPSAPTPTPTAGSPAPTPTAGTTTPLTTLAQPAIPAPTGSVSVPPAGAPVVPPTLALPLPVNPSTSATPVMFGSQIFTGRFSALSFTGFNPDYQVTVGDRLLVRLWGAVTYEAYQNVDAAGNIFVPQVGPVHLEGVRNSELNQHVVDRVKSVFKANVGVYVTVDSAQPVKVFVTGYASAPGMYAGLSSDSIISFLDKAGGVDPNRGSYIDIQVQRAGRVRATVNLYDFLLKGRLAPIQFQDGDIISVLPRQSIVTVNGQALNPYVFEFPAGTSLAAADLLKLAVPMANATNVSIQHTSGGSPTVDYRPLGQLAGVSFHHGDVVTFNADQYASTILVNVNGAELGDQSFAMPNGATLGDLLAKLTPAASANMAGIQLFRKSVAVRQKATLEISLRRLESMALTGRSKTLEESQLRTLESTMLLNFIDRARTVVPLGQVVLADPEQARKLPLEAGDTINIPARSNTVLVSGEVLFPNALLYNPKFNVDDYVAQAGGYIQPSGHDHQLVLRVDGSVAPAGSVPAPGDEIMILPKLESKNVELWRALTQVIYQIAVSAKVALGL